jgi:hypothetical protein
MIEVDKNGNGTIWDTIVNKYYFSLSKSIRLLPNSD